MTHRTEQKELSVIIPCYNEEKNLSPLYDRLLPVLQKCVESYEIIFIDDGSTDNTASKINELSVENSNIKGLILSRNFGKELALSAGLQYATGRASILIDADLQHPPEIIPEMVSKWVSGAKMVTAVRRDRTKDNFIRRRGSAFFYWIFNLIGEVKLNKSAGDFRLLDQRIVQILNNMPERARFSKGLFSWIGFNPETVVFDVETRHAGSAKFNLLKLMIYSISSVVSFSIAPIRIWFLIGLSVLLICAIYAVIVIVEVLFYGIKQPGYITTIFLIILFGGIQMLSLGIFGEYIGRILLEVKGRPQFIVAEELGFSDGEK
ncbi:MAG: glycosyltransferase family 2 protein [Alphaproteobacteria bacterium]